MHLSYICPQQIIMSNHFICFRVKQIRWICMHGLHLTELKYL